jgi:hypothetical protein
VLALPDRVDIWGITVATQAYLLTTQPEPRDPRKHMHQAAIRSLGLIEDRLRKHLLEKKTTYHKEK